MPVKFMENSCMTWNFHFTFSHFRFWRCFVGVRSPHDMHIFEQNALNCIVVLRYYILIINCICIICDIALVGVSVVSECFQFFQKIGVKSSEEDLGCCIWTSTSGKISPSLIGISTYIRNKTHHVMCIDSRPTGPVQMRVIFSFFHFFFLFIFLQG